MTGNTNETKILLNNSLNLLYYLIFQSYYPICLSLQTINLLRKKCRNMLTRNENLVDWCIQSNCASATWPISCRARGGRGLGTYCFYQPLLLYSLGRYFPWAGPTFENPKRMHRPFFHLILYGFGYSPKGSSSNFFSSEHIGLRDFRVESVEVNEGKSSNDFIIFSYV